MTSMRNPLERFIEKVDMTGDCWLWTAYIDRDGYGLFGVATGQTVRAHRWFYEQSVGPLPPGEPLDHLCRVRACVRPSHLELVTTKINNERGERAQQTHCVNGHEFTEANTYVKPNGCRQCRRCHHDREKDPVARRRRAEASARYRARKKEGH